MAEISAFLTGSGQISLHLPAKRSWITGLDNNSGTITQGLSPSCLREGRRPPGRLSAAAAQPGNAARLSFSRGAGPMLATHSGLRLRAPWKSRSFPATSLPWSNCLRRASTSAAGGPSMKHVGSWSPPAAAARRSTRHSSDSCHGFAQEIGARAHLGVDRAFPASPCMAPGNLWLAACRPAFPG